MYRYTDTFLDYKRANIEKLDWTALQSKERELVYGTDVWDVIEAMYIYNPTILMLMLFRVQWFSLKGNE